MQIDYEFETYRIHNGHYPSVVYFYSETLEKVKHIIPPNLLQHIRLESNDSIPIDQMIMAG